jgi:hypothetical protein
LTIGWNLPMFGSDTGHAHPHTESKMNPQRPLPGTHNPYFDRYISLIQEVDILATLDAQISHLRSGLAGLADEKAAYRYAEGKWSVRQVVGHVIDTERVFGYRALAVARGERTDLPSFDENVYASLAHHDSCPITELVEEFCELRSSHFRMFRHLDDSAWDRLGSVGGHATSARAMAFVIAGHTRHHASILASRYGLKIAVWRIVNTILYREVSPIQWGGHNQEKDGGIQWLRDCHHDHARISRNHSLVPHPIYDVVLLKLVARLECGITAFFE